MALAFPVFRMDRFCGVMPTAAASSLELVLRLASMTSRSIYNTHTVLLDRQLVGFAQLAALIHNPAYQNNDPSDQQVADISCSQGDRDQALRLADYASSAPWLAGLRETASEQRLPAWSNPFGGYT